MVSVIYVGSGMALIFCNMVGLLCATFFGTMVFLDTIGTAIAGLAGGPFAGMAVGVLTNLLTGGLMDRYRPYLKFFFVNLICGLLWGLVGQNWPLVMKTKQEMVIYILVSGLMIGLASAVLSVPMRIYSHFETKHVLDKVSRHFVANGLSASGYVKIFFGELLLSHLIDKIISTTVAVIFIVVTVQGNPAHLNISTTYHDLVELWGALYFVALGVAIKCFGVNMNADDEALSLLGPLGFFSLLIGLPVLFEAFGVH